MESIKTKAVDLKVKARMARTDAIDEFAERLMAGLHRCETVIGDNWKAGYVTGDVKQLIADIAAKMKAEV